MEFTDEAKREIEKNLGEVIKNINVDPEDRTDIVNELRSTYYEAAESEARARGSGVVTIEDARAAKESISSPRDTAECYMKSYAGKRKRAGFWPRSAACMIDYFALFAIILVFMLPWLAPMLILDMPVWGPGSEEMWDSIWNGIGNSPFSMYIMASVIVSAISFFIVIFSYFIVSEGYLGYTPGKYLLGLRVLKTDGTRIGYKEAFLRNLAKYNNYLIAIDALIMLIFFSKEKQRGSDRIADTMVVYARAKKEIKHG